MEELAQEAFDAVLEGTGLTLSVLSAALAVQGARIAVVDKEEQYGAQEATLAADLFKRGRFFSGFHCYEIDGHLEGMDLKKVNLDLCPRLVLCRGNTVDAMVRSGVSKYLEFKTLENAMFLDEDDTLLQVSCSKAEIFKSKDFSMADKRQLMRFIQQTLDTAIVQSAGGSTEAVRFWNEAGLNQGRSLSRPQNKRGQVSGSTSQGETTHDNETFHEFLSNSCGLSPRLCRAIMYAIALLPRKGEEVSRDWGMSRVRSFLQGLGRFGNTAFLCPVYGVSEISQAFCRLGAVHGGFYILRQEVESTEVVAEQQNMNFVRLGGGETFRCRHFISTALGGNESDSILCYEARLVSILNGPLLSLLMILEKEELEPILQASAMRGQEESGPRKFPDMVRLLLTITPDHTALENESPIHVLQLDHSVHACAPGKFVVHLSMQCQHHDAGLDVLSKAFEHLISRAQAKLGVVDDFKSLWSAKFYRSFVESSDTWQVSAPRGGVVFLEEYVKQAEALFARLRPGETFLPPEEDRKFTQMAGDEDDKDFMISRIRIPQLVDLSAFEFLGGRILDKTKLKPLLN